MKTRSEEVEFSKSYLQKLRSSSKSNEQHDNCSYTHAGRVTRIDHVETHNCMLREPTSYRVTTVLIFTRMFT